MVIRNTQSEIRYHDIIVRSKQKDAASGIPETFCPYRTNSSVVYRHMVHNQLKRALSPQHICDAMV